MYQLHSASLQRPHHLLQARRLLHIEASGSEVVIDYGLVRHIGSFDELTRLMEGGKVMETVGIFEQQVIPVVDIRGAFDTCITCSDQVGFPDFMVLNIENRQVGIRVDRVIEILLVPALDIDCSSGSGDSNADFVIGMVKRQARRMPLVDMQRLLRPMPHVASVPAA